MQSLNALYRELERDRSEFLERAYRSAVFTIPSVLPREGIGRSDLPQNYSSVGARGVNNLASKLQLSLFPSQFPFFRLTIDPFLKREIIEQAPAGQGAEAAATAQAEIEKNLSLIEETARIEFETSGWRPIMAEAMRHLVITGNGCVFVADEGIQFVDIRRFAVKRDPSGMVIKVVIHQKIDRKRAAALFPDGLEFTDDSTGPMLSDQPNLGNADRNSVSLYTGAILNKDGKYEFYQEINNEVVPGSQRNYTPETLPILALRFTAISGENYGSSYVEEYDGDLLALEMLSRAMTEAALAASRTLILVRPGAAIHPRTVAEAPNGAVKQGNPEDVAAFKLDKQADFAVAERRATAIEQRLQLAFLITFQRQAERVTAEEVRQVVQELEEGLGGVHSHLSESVQRPIVNFLLDKVLKRKDVPDIPDNVDPIISTGLEAISRGQMAQRIMTAGSIAQQVLGEEAVRALDPHATLVQIFTSVGLDADALLKSKETLQQEQQQAQAMALAERAAPNVVNAMSAQAQSQAPTQ